MNLSRAGLMLLVLSSLFTGSCSRPEKDDQNTLVIWQSYNNEESAVFQKIVRQFEASHPGVRIRSERVPFDGLLPKLITAAIAGKTPDIARVDLGHIARLAYGKAILPLDEKSANAIFTDLMRIARDVSAVQLPGEAQRKYFAVPDQLSTVALYYNKKLLAERGLIPPRTIGDLNRMAGKFEPGRALGLNASLWWMMPWLFVHDAEILSPDLTRCLLAEPKAVSAMQFVHNLYAMHKLEGGAWLSGSINPDQGFLTGRYAMVLSGPWNLRTFATQPYGVTLVPGTGANISASNIGGTAMVIFAGTRKNKLAVEFLGFLASKQVQIEWATETGQFSVNLRANAALGNALTADMRTFLNQLEFARARPQLPGYDALESVAAPYIYSALDGSMPVGEAMSKACREIEKTVLAEIATDRKKHATK